MPSLLPTLRSLPRPAWILFSGTFVNRFGTFVMPFLAIYLTREGYSATQAGVAISVYGAGHIIAAMLGDEDLQKLYALAEHELPRGNWPEYRRGYYRLPPRAW